jgi:hypothetical protein
MDRWSSYLIWQSWMKRIPTLQYRDLKSFKAAFINRIQGAKPGERPPHIPSGLSKVKHIPKASRVYWVYLIPMLAARYRSISTKHLQGSLEDADLQYILVN